MIPTIQTEIELLQNTKDELRTAIMEKGVSVSSNDLFSTYPTRISQISMTPGYKDDLFKSLIDRSITSLVVPDGTEILRPHVFSGCSNITSLTLPNSLKIIYNGALTGLHGVTTLVIPDSVTTIEGSSSFHQTSSLTTLTIGTGITFIGNMVFYGNPNLTSITINATTPPELGLNNNAFDNTNNCPIYVPAASVDAYKTAWPTYASRIQAIYVPPRFMKVTNINDMTSGTYLLVEESFGIALNASLIKNTNTQSSGINDNTSNTESVTINNGVIAENQTTDNCKFEYDATKGKLKKSISTYYYLRPGVYSGTLQQYFDYVNKTNEYSGETEVTPMSTDNGFTFKSIYENKALGYNTAKTNRIRWYSSSSSDSFTNVALYKLVQ